MYPPLRLPLSQKEIATVEWQNHFETIKRLYLEEDRTLADVKAIMQREYNFRAT